MNQIMEPTVTRPVLSTPKSFPVAGTNLAKILSDPEYRQTFHHQLHQFNPLVVALYKVGLLSVFGVSRTVMLLTTRGRKSGKLRSTPIGYFRIGGAIHLFSAWGRSTGWYRNLKACPGEIWIRIGLHQWPVFAQELADPDEILRTIGQFVRESPAQARYLLGWDPERDTLEGSDFSTILNRVLIVRFTEKK